jgi:hypothetical protein
VDRNLCKFRNATKFASAAELKKFYGSFRVVFCTSHRLEATKMEIENTFANDLRNLHVHLKRLKEQQCPHMDKNRFEELHHCFEPSIEEIKELIVLLRRNTLE